MATQRLIHAIPVEIQQVDRLNFSRATLQPGVSLHRAVGPLARKVAECAKFLPIRPGFVSTHLIIVDQSEYLTALDKRLVAAGTERVKPKSEFIDLHGITRQVLIAVTLLGRGAWTFGGNHMFDHSDPSLPYASAGYSHRPTEGVGALLRYSATSGWFVNIRARDLRTTCEQLDRYYRHGSWWVDRLSVALGYLWSGLTSPHPELAFVAFCTSLEAIASTSQNEITHILAERCAVLVHRPGLERVAMYAQIKDLYALRSKIVHGRSAPRKGPVNWETLAITAKQSLVPRSEVVKLLGVTIQVLNSVLARPQLLELLHVRRSEEKASEAMNHYFLHLLLRGEA